MLVGCLGFAASLMIISAAGASSVRVIDGDTLEVNSIRYRLHGIDAPEAGQKCNRAGGGQWPCGRAAISRMQELVSRGKVVCDDRGADGYGRTIAVCRADEIDINSTMISAGLAWAFRKYSDDYIAQENAAQSQARGIWQANTETPWAYRSQKWNVARQETPDGCPIKGNVSEQGKVYHPPWSPWYSKTKVTLSKGERWFCSEADAVAAGWRAPQWGN